MDIGYSDNLFIDRRSITGFLFTVLLWIEGPVGGSMQDILEASCEYIQLRFSMDKVFIKDINH